MNSSSLIRKRLAVLLLVIFGVSAVPKIFLHDAVSGHKDAPVCVEKAAGTEHFHHPTYHCQQDDWVTTTPFLNLAQPFTTPHRLIGSTQYPVSHEALWFFSLLHAESRGPPMLLFSR